MASNSIALSRSSSSSVIRNSALNNSTSKMQYTFARGERFMSEKKLSTHALFYDLPDARETRATNLGFGKKLSFEDKRVIPSANTYHTES